MALILDLEMGFLFLDGEHGVYMVALSCENRGCGSPLTGIRLHRSESLWDERPRPTC